MQMAAHGCGDLPRTSKVPTRQVTWHYCKRSQVFDIYAQSGTSDWKAGILCLFKCSHRSLLWPIGWLKARLADVHWHQAKHIMNLESSHLGSHIAEFSPLESLSKENVVAPRRDTSHAPRLTSTDLLLVGESDSQHDRTIRSRSSDMFLRFVLSSCARTQWDDLLVV